MIYVDADACPVVKLTEKIARQNGVPVCLICDTNHILHSDYAQVVQVSAGADAVDFALVSKLRAGDIVITQDYGVAALTLARGAYALHQSGMEYTPDNIDGLLAARHAAKAARRASGKHHLKGPKKRCAQDDKNFAAALIGLLERISS